MNTSPNKIIFCQARIPHGNQGDLVLTKILISQLRQYGQIIVNDSEVPEWYCQQLDLKDQERSSFYGMNFALMIWAYGLKTLFQPNSKVYFLLRPGHFYGSSFQLGLKMLIAAFYYFALRLIGVRICRFGTSIESLSPLLETAEKLRSNAMHFYSVRDSLSEKYALEIGINHVKVFPDLAWFLQKKNDNDDLKWLMQVPNSNDQVISKEKKYVVFSFREKFREFDSSDYKANLLEVLDPLVQLVCGDWQYKLVISYQVSSDLKFSKELIARYKDDYDVILVEKYIDSCTMYELYSQAEIVFSNRLHVLMFSMFCGTLPVAIVNQSKERRINGIFSDAELEEVILDIGQGSSKIIDNLPILVGNSESIKEKIKMCFEQKRHIGEKLLAQVFN